MQPTAPEEDLMLTASNKFALELLMGNKVVVTLWDKLGCGDTYSLELVGKHLPSGAS